MADNYFLFKLRDRVGQQVTVGAGAFSVSGILDSIEEDYVVISNANKDEVVHVKLDHIAILR